MDSPRAQLSLSMMLAVVAGIAVNLWLFRLGMLWGVLGLTATKHLVIAHLCHVVGLNRKAAREGIDPPPPRARPFPEPSSN